MTKISLSTCENEIRYRQSSKLKVSDFLNGIRLKIVHNRAQLFTYQYCHKLKLTLPYFFNIGKEVVFNIIVRFCIRNRISKPVEDGLAKMKR